MLSTKYQTSINLVFRFTHRGTTFSFDFYLSSDFFGLGLEKETFVGDSLSSLAIKRTKKYWMRSFNLSEYKEHWQWVKEAWNQS